MEGGATCARDDEEWRRKTVPCGEDEVVALQPFVGAEEKYVEGASISSMERVPGGRVKIVLDVLLV